MDIAWKVRVCIFPTNNTDICNISLLVYYFCCGRLASGSGPKAFHVLVKLTPLDQTEPMWLVGSPLWGFYFHNWHPPSQKDLQDSALNVSGQCCELPGVFSGDLSLWKTYDKESRQTIFHCYEFSGVTQGYLNIKKNCHSQCRQKAALLYGFSDVSLVYPIGRMSCHSRNRQKAYFLYESFGVSSNNLTGRKSCHSQCRLECFNITVFQKNILRNLFLKGFWWG